MIGRRIGLLAVGGLLLFATAGVALAFFLDTNASLWATLEQSSVYQRYARQNPNESATVKAYWLNGGAKPSVATKFGTFLVEVNEDRVGTQPPPPPPPPPTDTTPTTPPPPPPTGSCDTTTPNVPGGPDGNGGCFPGLGNTGPNAPASSMAAYTGPCNITAANTVIDSKVIRCDVTVSANGLIIKNSYVFGAVHGGGPTFTIQDSIVDGARSNGFACINCGVDNDNFTVLRTEIIHTNRGAYCSSNCLIQDSYVHGTNLEPVSSNLAHASGIREEQGTTLRHNSISCDFKGPFVNSEIGCSADLTGYPDFAPIKNNTIDRNLFVANTQGNAFCAYGGATNGKPFSGAADNATNIKFTNNVFQKGTGGHPGPCGDFGAVADFNGSRTGNVFTGNKYDDGTTVTPG